MVKVITEVNSPYTRNRHTRRIEVIVGIVYKEVYKMKYLHAALILHEADKEITAEAISKIIAAADIEVDESRIKGLISVLETVDIEEALESAPMMAAGPAAKGAEAPKSTPESSKEEEEEQEEQEEEEEEGEDLGLDSLFG